MNLFLPERVYFSKQDGIEASVLHTDNISWNTKVGNRLNGFKYNASFLRIMVDPWGFSLEDVFNEIERLNKYNYTDINKYNTTIHIYNKGYNFYYPKIYEDICLDISLNENISSIKVNIYSFNEFWIKNIIE